MVGRNQPCACGSGKKYKKCCERVVMFRQAELMRENREREQKGELLKDLDHWFHRYAKVEDQAKWATRFKELIRLPIDQPIPKNFAFSFHYYLLFDAPCINGKRPVELWASTIRHRSDGERVIQSLSELCFSCYEVLDSDQETMTFRSLQTNKLFEVMKKDVIPRDKLVFTRLIRIGNRYELFGPYTSFVHEMRGEILVQLEKYNHEEEQQELTIRETSWKVLGWSIQRANELETMEQQLSSVPTEMRLEKQDNLLLSVMEHQIERQGLPVSILNQLEQFYVSEVTPLQKGTQAWYSRSLETLFQYLSLRFGQSFEWSLLTEDVLAHFFSIWYMDHHQSTPVSARIFLNTCKHLFRWLEKTGNTKVFQVFKKVYIPFIRLLPETVEARSWLMENGIMDKQGEKEQRDMFLINISSAGPVILIDEQWRPIPFRSFPSMWADRRFWVKGTVVRLDNNQYVFTKIENLYPVVVFEEQVRPEIQVLQK